MYVRVASEGAGAEGEKTNNQGRSVVATRRRRDSTTLSAGGCKGWTYLAFGVAIETRATHFTPEPAKLLQ